jgi:hypothetical protein
MDKSVRDSGLFDARTDPPLGSWIASEFLTISGTGRSYSVTEASWWLSRTSFQFIELNPLGGPQCLIAGEVV